MALASMLQRSRCLLAVFLTVLPICTRPSLAQGAPADLPRVTLPDAPSLIYSRRPDDPWNQIFYFLFSRRLAVRLSPDFPEGAPFLDPGERISVSRQVFEKDEIGDRAIEPLYPTFFVGFGGMLVLRDPAYSRFTKSLKAALDDDSPRSAVARALMQNDLWGAYDEFFFPLLPDDEKLLGVRRMSALDLIGHFIRKIALTPAEIGALPENYSAVARRQSLPDVFGKDSGWTEIEWFMPRAHDDAAGFRKVSRVFLKPDHPPRNMKKFLNSLADDPQNVTSLAGVALVIQLLLVDSHGDLRPTRLVVDAQTRLFERTPEGKIKASVKEAEISRKLYSEDPNSGGLVLEDERTPAYLSNGGSYEFAEGQIMPGQKPEIREPVQVRLRTRCALCHGEDLQQLMTFSIARPPHHKGPPIRQLDREATEAADVDIGAKRKQETFKALLEYFR
ncbi:MAG TPA: hypothetical protein VGM18_20415 [Candidatus Sulfotelmatobacter sp.]